jgi:hypothetical protein
MIFSSMDSWRELHVGFFGGVSIHFLEIDAISIEF